MKTRVNKIHPHIGGGNPVVSSMKRVYFNDILGTTIGAKKRSRYYPTAITAFGEAIETGDTHFQAYTRNSCTFFTGKPQVEGLGYAFLFRNYRATLAKWQTADPIGYPDGWNDPVVSEMDFLLVLIAKVQFSLQAEEVESYWTN